MEIELKDILAIHNILDFIGNSFAHQEDTTFFPYVRFLDEKDDRNGMAI